MDAEPQCEKCETCKVYTTNPVCMICDAILCDRCYANHSCIDDCTDEEKSARLEAR